MRNDVDVQWMTAGRQFTDFKSIFGLHNFRS